MPPDGLTRRMATGALWLVALRFSVRAMGGLSTLFVAPLLTPADFGLVVLATTFAALLEITTDFSLDLALIRDQKAGRPEYDTAFTLNLLKSLLIAMLLVAAADPVAAFFGDPRLEPVFHWLAVVSIAGGLINIGVVDFRKELDIAKEFRLHFWPKLLSVLAAVGLAFIWRNHWALVMAIVLRRLVLVVQSYMMSAYRPRLTFSRWRSLLSFSKWLLVNNLLMFVRDRIDTLIIGKLVGPSPLGLYTVALEIADLPTTELAAPVSRAVFPGYTRLAAQRDQLARNYLDTFSVMMLVSLPTSLGIGLVAEPAIRLWLGEAWLEAVPLVQALIGVGLLRTAYANAGSVYLALGYVRIEPALMLVYIALLVPLLYLLLPAYGVLGAAFALTITAAVNLVLNKLILVRLLALRPILLVDAVWRIVAASLAMAGALLWLPVPFVSELGRLLWMILFGAGVFLTTLLSLCQLQGWPEGPESKVLAYLQPSLRRRGCLSRLQAERQ